MESTFSTLTLFSIAFHESLPGQFHVFHDFYEERTVVCISGTRTAALCRGRCNYFRKCYFGIRVFLCYPTSYGLSTSSASFSACPASIHILPVQSEQNTLSTRLTTLFARTKTTHTNNSLRGQRLSVSLSPSNLARHRIVTLQTAFVNGNEGSERPTKKDNKQHGVCDIPCSTDLTTHPLCSNLRPPTCIKQTAKSATPSAAVVNQTCLMT
ncbi:hypothetical protein BaRGS_00009898 [Batillaria attramentaria]|uniref:Uncharacterized protein n=1 Tax=Batillaria attramentaria TaxID=370345 RepID=A0ABD0LH30_9CAEN